MHTHNIHWCHSFFQRRRSVNCVITPIRVFAHAQFRRIILSWANKPSQDAHVEYSVQNTKLIHENTKWSLPIYLVFWIFPDWSLSVLQHLSVVCSINISKSLNLFISIIFFIFVCVVYLLKCQSSGNVILEVYFFIKLFIYNILIVR